MAKKTRIEGYSVIVFVPVRDDSAWVAKGNGVQLRMQRSPEQARREAEEIKSAIARHLAHDYADVRKGPIDIEAQSILFCEHCGNSWTEKSDTYNGGCCDKDEAANPETIDDLLEQLDGDGE